MVTGLSRHFVRRWQERLGGSPPSLEEVRSLCTGGQCLKRGETLWKEVGGRLKPWRTVTMIWCSTRGGDVVIWLDPDTGRAITVIPRENGNGVA